MYKDTKYFKNKKIIITGHTGFKGSWLALWLHSLGAEVLGLSKDVPTQPSHFKILKLEKKIKSKKINLTNYQQFKNHIIKFKPDFIFHLAAQSIVKKSYTITKETWESNLISTINLLESLKPVRKKTNVIIITSDKVYKNIETKKGYQENDRLGGLDPYGASKSATEIAIQSYINSFFQNKNNNIRICTARAGNVIGGGDWSPDRLIPDCIRSWSKNKTVKIRNPNSTRPWQHVLEVIFGYLTLAINLKSFSKLHGESFNFGPKYHNYKVSEVLNEIKKIWPSIKWNYDRNTKFKENQLLNLNSKKAYKVLRWKQTLTFKEQIKMVVNWYKFFSKDKKSIYNKSLEQINHYRDLVYKKRNFF
jgi:CDP-glucose 4,6-dehydratase